MIAVGRQRVQGRAPALGAHWACATRRCASQEAPPIACSAQILLLGALRAIAGLPTEVVWNPPATEQTGRPAKLRGRLDTADAQQEAVVGPPGLATVASP